MLKNANIKEKKGITLLALIVTIIILLILAGITISALTGENGIIKSSEEAKDQTEIANEREILEKAILQSMAEDARGNLKKETLQKRLDEETGEEKTEVEDVGEDFEVLFIDTNRYYTVGKDGILGETQEIVADKNPGDITKDSEGNSLDGSEEHPYEICCIEDLIVFSNIVNGIGVKFENNEVVQIDSSDSLSGKYVILKKNLNFKSKFSYNNFERTDFGDINGDSEDGNVLMHEMISGMGFRPIGLGNTRYFSGVFDGNNKKIDNIYINYENDSVLDGYGIGRSIGLFGRGNNTTTTIKNLEISGEIKSKGHTGGIIGYAAKRIENCINNANIKGYNMAGGIIGFNNVEIEKCENNGTVEVTGIVWGYGGAGGISGCNTNSIKDCTNRGEIIGRVSGGIVGATMNNALIDNCINLGIASSGICDLQRADKLEILNCYNLGECKNSGIIGNVSGGDNYQEYELIISNSYNLGKIENAGIINMMECIAKTIKVNIENVYNSGECMSSIIKTIYRNPIITINNVYYNPAVSQEVGAVTEGIKEIDEVKIKDSSFVDILNNNRGNNLAWKKWKQGEDGYPTFE